METDSSRTWRVRRRRPETRPGALEEAVLHCWLSETNSENEKWAGASARYKRETRRNLGQRAGASLNGGRSGTDRKMT